jgi:hypothetical protein
LLYVRNGTSVYQAAGMSAVSVAGSGYSPNLNFWAQDGASTFATRMTIDPSGNLGIGTSLPTYKLEVSAATDVAQFTATDAGASGAQVNVFHDSASPANDDVTSLINFSGRDSAAQATIYSRVSGISTNVTNGSESGAIAFSTRNSGTFAERMRLTSVGELLVGGTTSVQASAGVITAQTSGGGYFNCFRNDTSIGTGNDFGGLWWYGNDTTSNTPTGHAWVQAIASGTHDPGDNPTDIAFATTPDGTATVAEAGRITQAGSYVLKGGTTTAAAGVGIIFPATQVASANANSLDDYEEGTWTPAWAFSTSGSATATLTSATYIKIGKMVYIRVRLGTGTPSSPTGDVTITGLPFTSANDSTNQHAALAIGEKFRWGTDMPNLTAMVDNNSTSITLYKQATDAVSLTALQGSDMSINLNYNVLTITGCYEATA